jgi:uncharacterized protein YukE
MGELKDAEPITFDAGAADDLAAKFTATATLLRTQVAQRRSLATAARTDWKGSYEVKFGARMDVCETDAGKLADALDVAAKEVKELARLAKEEQDRRTKARAWKHEHDAWQRQHDAKSGLEQGVDSLFHLDDAPKPPPLDPHPEPQIPIAAPQQQSRA